MERFRPRHLTSLRNVAGPTLAFTPAQVFALYNSAFQLPVTPVTLNIQRVGANLQLSWPSGTLLEADAITGPYTTNNATSPYTFAPAATKKFFRVKVQ
jgi:hypothetical protein